VSTPESTLVVSAHAADFVWRAGGAIALAAARGDRVTVLCLTYGERGESASAWRAGQALEEIKALRRAEACSAAARRNAGPNLGLPQSTLAEAYMRVFPQVTDRLA